MSTYPRWDINKFAFDIHVSKKSHLAGEKSNLEQYIKY